MKAADDHVDVLGQGPELCTFSNTDYLYKDPDLARWTESVDHDGRGIPAHLMGKRVRLYGVSHDRRSSLHLTIVQITPEYIASDAAAVWDWSLGFGGVSGYRIERAEPLPFDDEVILALNLKRRGNQYGYSFPLQIGLDGVEE